MLLLRLLLRDGSPLSPPEPMLSADDVLSLRQIAAEIHIAPEVRDYAVRIVRATRSPAELAEQIAARATKRRETILDTGGRAEEAHRLEILRSSPVSLGASPRASMFLSRAARARALLDGRRYAPPTAVKRMAPAVLRHRVLVTYEAEADGITPEAVVDAVLSGVETP